jgi:hypothetical protein
MEKLGGESTGQRWMEVENEEGQDPLWALVPLMMIKVKFQAVVNTVMNIQILQIAAEQLLTFKKGATRCN